MEGPGESRTRGPDGFTARDALKNVGCGRLTKLWRNVE